MVTPIVLSRSTVRQAMPWSMLAAILLTVMCLDSVISRWDALVLFVLFCTFIGYNLREARKGKAQPDEEEEGKAMRPILAVGLVLLGLGCLVLGSNVFVDSATRVAQQLGVSEAVIGLTIVAGGTSLPELATSVVAARKGQSAIAIGNVIGSNVFNVLMIIGITGLVKPMNINGITNVDLGVMTGSMVLVWLFSYTKFKVERWEGAVLTGIFTAYMCWLISLVI
jgi:cation:H+ antiporter